MKLFLLSAAALLASPALAQTTPAGGGDTMSTPAPQTTTPPGGDTMSTTQPMSGQTAPTGADPVGGYQPAPSASSGPPPAGSTVTYQQAPSPDQAYPAPAPMAKYPICKAGQYDDCMQGSASHRMAGHHKMMRKHKK